MAKPKNEITPSPELVATLLNIYTTTPPNVPVLDTVLKERTGEDLRHVRAGIKVLVEEYGLPVVSDRNHSYLLCTKAGFILEEVARLRSQATRIEQRADALVGYVRRIGQLPPGYLQDGPHDDDADEVIDKLFA